MLSPSQLTIKSSGSATGNPRNKCALKPGHSLMDWIRLGNSGVDLTGFQGRIVPISSDELAKHNTREDAWLAIRGKVYNVTRYMDFHPGGVDELMRGVGRDATKLFNQVHAWVNYQQLLAKCYIGPLKHSVKIDKDIFMSLKTKAEPSELGLPPLPQSVEIIPRFDWIQKQSDLTLYFYTKQDCNPSLIVQHKNPKQMNINIQILNVTHQFEFEFHAEVDWPPKMTHINSETGKIELNLSKSVSALWTTYGTNLVTKALNWSIGNDIDELPFSFEVISNEKFNHDSFELCLNNPNYIIVPAIGFHFTIAASINGQCLSRSYTPVSQRFSLKTKASLPSSCLRFVIKNYGKQGQLSAHLGQLTNGSNLQLSMPRGGFKTKSLKQRKEIVLLAAGSGLTPCLSLLAHTLSCRLTKADRILLVYFNKTEADIWFNEEIKTIADSDERIKFVNVLSQASSDWLGYKGHISTELLIDLLGKKALTSDTFVAICGPSVFNNLAETCLKELHCKDEDFHTFQG